MKKACLVVLVAIGMVAVLAGQTLAEDRVAGSEGQGSHGASVEAICKGEDHGTVGDVAGQLYARLHGL